MDDVDERKIALHLEERPLVSFESEIQPLETGHKNDNVVLLIQTPKRMSEHLPLTNDLMLILGNVYGGGQ